MARKGENIYKRKDGRWEARYIVGRDTKGRAKYRSVYAWSYLEVKKKRQDAMLRLADMDYEGQRKAGTIESVATAWIRDSAHKWKESTKCRYQEKLDIYILPQFGKREFSDISTAIKIDLWYPTGTPEPECVIAHDSILPVINFYHSRLLTTGLNIRKCKVCGKYFLAESLKYELCSEKCRKEQGKIKKREFDARAVENSYDRTYKNECQRWRNIIHRAEKSEDTSPEQLSKMKSAFKSFKTEALKRKTAVKNGQSSSKEFEDWILVQSSILYKL